MQLVTLPSHSNTFNTSTVSLSRDRELYGSPLMQQTHRDKFNKQSNQNEDKPKINTNKLSIGIHQKYEYNNNISNSSLLNIKPNNGNCFSLHECLLSMDIIKYKNIFISEEFDKLVQLFK